MHGETLKFIKKDFDVGTQRTSSYEPTNWSVPAILGIGLPHEISETAKSSFESCLGLPSYRFNSADTKRQSEPGVHIPRATKYCAVTPTFFEPSAWKFLPVILFES